MVRALVHDGYGWVLVDDQAAISRYVLALAAK